MSANQILLIKTVYKNLNLYSHVYVACLALPTPKIFFRVGQIENYNVLYYSFLCVICKINFSPKFFNSKNINVHFAQIFSLFLLTGQHGFWFYSPRLTVTTYLLLGLVYMDFLRFQKNRFFA